VIINTFHTDNQVKIAGEATAQLNTVGSKILATV
jgi:hypothetical protein